MQVLGSAVFAARNQTSLALQPSFEPTARLRSKAMCATRTCRNRQWPDAGCRAPAGTACASAIVAQPVAHALIH